MKFIVTTLVIAVAALTMALRPTHAQTSGHKTKDVTKLYAKPDNSEKPHGPWSSKTMLIHPNSKLLRESSMTIPLTIKKYHSEGQFWVINTDKGDFISETVPLRIGSFEPTEKNIHEITWHSQITGFIYENSGTPNRPIEFVGIVDQNNSEKDYACSIDITVNRIELSHGEQIMEMSPLNWMQCRTWKDRVGITPGFSISNVQNPMTDPNWR